MRYRRLAGPTFVGLFALVLLSTPAGASIADPLAVRFARPAAPTADEELALANEAEKFRVTLAFAVRIEVARQQYVQTLMLAAMIEQAKVEYVSALAAAAIEQTRYDEQRRVAAAVERDSEPESTTAGGAPLRTPPAAAPSRAGGTGSVNGYPCGGDLPPCSVLARESGGNPDAENPTSSASGLWQFIDGTWDGYGGYAHASDAPADVQNARAAELWAGGAGCGHWSETDGCG
jgi:hypothetical protein